MKRFAALFLSLCLLTVMLPACSETEDVRTAFHQNLLAFREAEKQAVALYLYEESEQPILEVLDGALYYTADDNTYCFRYRDMLDVIGLIFEGLISFELKYDQRIFARKHP